MKRPSRILRSWQAFWNRMFRSSVHDDALLRLTEKMEAEFAERRKIERELAHLASFAEMDPNIIIETDMTGNVLYRNIVAQEEFPDLETRGREHPLLDGLKAVVEVFRNEKKSLLSRLLKVGERVFRQQITLIDQGARLRIYVTDVTELKRLDQLKTEFVNTVSHELRTPLTGLQASVRMLQSDMLGPTTPDQQAALTLAVSGIQRLARLVSNLLDISKIEAGKLDLHYDEADLAEVASEIARSVEPLARERGLEIRLRLPPEPLRVFIDRDKILQVFSNLVSNALKFSRHGAVEIEVAVRGEEALCAVKDTGPGIAPNDLPKLFGKFQQIGQPSGSVEKGTGLGLSICKGIVELHQGKIWVESRLGEGTHFLFTLPRVSAENIFRDQALRLFEQAVAASKPLCLFAFHLQNWPDITQRLSREQADALMDRFEILVRSTSRGEHDPLVKTPGRIWLAVPGADKNQARQVADRIELASQDYAFQAGAQTPLAVEYGLAAYPEDGKVAEQLLATVLQFPSTPAAPFAPNPKP